MAHNIDMSRGEPAFLAAKVGGWHGLGRVVPELFDSKEGILGSGMDWDVTLEDLRVGDAVLPRHKATVRSDTKAVLGVVGNGYKPFQNVDVWAFADQIIGGAKAVYDTAGVLDGGRKVWVLADLNSAFEARPGDAVKPYMLISNSHDGSQNARVLLTTVRVVCQNTLSVAVSSAANMLRIRHTGDIGSKVEEAQRLCGVVYEQLARFADATKRLARQQWSVAQTAEFVAKVLEGRGERGVKKASERIAELLEAETQRVAGVGSAWAAYNAVSEWVDWDSNFRSEASQFESTLYGAAHETKSRAFGIALSMAG